MTRKPLPRQNTYRFTFRDIYGSCRITVVSHNLQQATIEACRKYGKHDVAHTMEVQVELDTICAEEVRTVNHIAKLGFNFLARK